MKPQRGFHGRLLPGNTVALRHGHTRLDGWRSRTYYAWASMLSRCEDPNHAAYARYGGRGISVCARWHVFENFLADMGECPDGLTLDRFPNGNGNYEPGNCRWATWTEQARNRDVTKLDLSTAVEIMGRLEHGEGTASVAKRFGICHQSVSDIKCGRIYREIAPFQGWIRGRSVPGAADKDTASQTQRDRSPRSPQLPKGMLTQVAKALSEAQGPLTLQEIAERIGKQSTAASSATRLIRTTLLADMRTKGAESYFVRVSPGIYALQKTFSLT